MAKSEGNFVRIRDLVNRWPGDVLRLQMLATHYRQPIDWTEVGTQRARDELEEWSESLQTYFNFKNPNEPNAVIRSLADDINTPDAISVLRDLHIKARKGGMNEKLIFATNCRFLGFRNLDKPGFFRLGVSGLNVGQHRLFDYQDDVDRLRAAIANNAPQTVRDEIAKNIRSAGLDVDISRSGDITLIRGDQSQLTKDVERLVAARTAARKAKNFAESDRIRDELVKMGVVLKDSKDGTTWEIAR